MYHLALSSLIGGNPPATLVMRIAFGSAGEVQHG